MWGESKGVERLALVFLYRGQSVCENVWGTASHSKHSPA